MSLLLEILLQDLLTKRLGIEDGTVLDEPLIEYCLKNDELGDPLISKTTYFNFKWSTKKEIEKIDKQCT